MMTLDQARQDVQGSFAAALHWAESDEKRSFQVFEQHLWSLLLSVGRALVVLFLVRQVYRPRSTTYVHDKRQYQVDGVMTTSLGTRFGKVKFSRPVGRLVKWRRRAVDLFVDRELGLNGGFSLGVIGEIARLCAQMSFNAARDVFQRFHEWAPCPRTVLRMVDGVGAKARSFLEQAPPPADDGDMLVALVDGRGAPMISSTENKRRRQKRVKPANKTRHGRRARRRQHPRVRRTKGKKSKNAKVAFVGVLYTLRRTKDGLDGPIGKRVYATFESHEALFKWLQKEAKKRGYGVKPMLFIADGSAHIWRLQQQYFPDAEVCLDWYHAAEKVWNAGECLFREDSDELKQWVFDQLTLLRRGACSKLLRRLSDEYNAIPKTGPGNRGKRKRMLETINYLTEHQPRMHYDVLRRKDLDIASGAVEGAVRNLVAIRLDGPGMRWSRGRSELMLHLRCVLINGQWDDFARYLAERGPLKLPAVPAPTETYDARAAA
jgi:hypothetical protein